MDNATGANDVRRKRKRRIAVPIVLAVGLAGSLAVFAGTNANAGTAFRVGHIYNWRTGICLESGDQGNVFARACDPNNRAQAWVIDGPNGLGANGHELVTVTDNYTGMALQYVRGQNRLETTYNQFDESSVQWTADGSDWTDFRLIAGRDPGTPWTCLDIGAARVASVVACADSGQNWSFIWPENMQNG